MALEYRGGFVRDIDTGEIATTTVKTGAEFRGGFLRSPDGRLVISSG